MSETGGAYALRVIAALSVMYRLPEKFVPEA